MRKILVYGDSFAASDNKQYQSWVDIIGKKLDLDVINRAVSGSSTEYAMSCLISDINDNTFEKNDIVIFVSSTVGRMHFQFQRTRPETASQYWHEVDISEPKHRWYKDNKKYLEWWMVNHDNKITAINHECYVHFLKNLSEQYTQSIVIHLDNSPSGYSDTDVLSLGKVPKNFLKPAIYLNTVSSNEIIDFKSYNDFVEYTGSDPRINHLSIINLNILANLIAYAIDNKTVNHISYGAFEQQILRKIQTPEQYLSYIGKELLYNIPEPTKNLSKRWLTS
jgi:hypothetical protein